MTKGHVKYVAGVQAKRVRNPSETFVTTATRTFTEDSYMWKYTSLNLFLCKLRNKWSVDQFTKSFHQTILFRWNYYCCKADCLFMSMNRWMPWFVSETYMRVKLFVEKSSPSLCQCTAARKSWKLYHLYQELHQISNIQLLKVSQSSGQFCGKNGVMWSC